MSGEIHISSLVVTADPRRLDDVVARIGALEAAEVALADPTGKLIVTLEAVSEQDLVQGFYDIQLLPGVAAAALCYQHSEPAARAARTEPNGRS